MTKAKRMNKYTFWFGVIAILIVVGMMNPSHAATDTAPSVSTASVSTTDYNNTDTLSAALLSGANANAASSGMSNTVSTVTCLPSGSGSYDCRFVWADGSVNIHTFLVAADGSSYLAKAQ
jgi:hypothetical protein